MALRERNRVKTMTVAGTESLKADADEAFRIKDIMCKASANDTFLTLTTKGVTVGMFRVAGKAGNHVPFPCVKSAQVYEENDVGVMRWLRARGFDMSFPVASGETFTISRPKEDGLISLVYDVYDPPDVDPGEPNGSMSNIRRYLHYADNSVDVESTPITVDTSGIWSGGEQFPFDGSAVAERNRISIAAILAAPCAAGDDTDNHGYSTYLTLIRRNDVLFDEDRNGLPFNGNSAATAIGADYSSLGSIIGPLTDVNPYPGLFLEDPIVCEEGDKLTTQVVIANAGDSGIVGYEFDICFVMEHEYLR